MFVRVQESKGTQGPLPKLVLAATTIGMLALLVMLNPNCPLLTPKLGQPVWMTGFHITAATP